MVSWMEVWFSDDCIVSFVFNEPSAISNINSDMGIGPHSIEKEVSVTPANSSLLANSCLFSFCSLI